MKDKNMKKVSSQSSASSASAASIRTVKKINNGLPNSRTGHLTGAEGALYNERVQSFKNNDWPWIDPTQHVCTPDELAMSGFLWEKMEGEYPKIVCFACDITEEVNNLSPETEPWELHLQLNPNCPYVKLGRRKLPREYKFKEIFNIVANKATRRKAEELHFVEGLVQTEIRNLKEFETDDVEK